MRCRNCDNMMSLSEMRATQLDGSPEDMCRSCLSHVWNIDQEEQRSYMFEFVKEGLAEARPIED